MLHVQVLILKFNNYEDIKRESKRTKQRERESKRTRQRERERVREQDKDRERET
jgi:hypothetical protein